MKRIRQTILLLLFSGLLILSVWQISSILGSYREGQRSYSELEQYVSFSPGVVSPTLPETEPAPPATEPELTPDSTAPVVTTAPTEPDDTLWPSVDFQRLAQINPDIVGWIYIEGTSVSYPIVQGSDNKYYLNHLFDGSYNSAGCIFLDAECTPDLSDRHSIIYGHNMKDQAMFAGLMAYKEQSFFDAHPVVLILTPECNFRIRLFSGYVADGSESAWKRKFPEGSFSSWLEEITEKSCFTPALLPGESDRIVTLSTCTYEYDSARFVLHGYIERSIPQ